MAVTVTATTTEGVNLSGTSLIGNSDVVSTGPAFQATDPATGTALEPVYHDATAGDVDRAAELAWDAFSAYRHTSFEQRAAFSKPSPTKSKPSAQR